ncbi:MAG TPA: SMC family ATPase [Gemmatimonadales bacterium]|nr:SMC family ATPase [Gemmatimonadales bacterium]
MRIHRLRLVNFRQHELTDIEFGTGLTGIIGPNGAGKTTLLEAIAWAMYGMPAARGNRETIRRRGAGPRAKVEVELDFTLGAHEYRVVRGLTTAELYQDGEPAPIAISLGAVTERITRLLGMTRDEFFNTYFTGQKELAVMAAMTAPERAHFLSRVLGYERIRAAQERLKEKRSALRARLEALRAGLPDPAELEEEDTRARARLSGAQAAEAIASTRFAKTSATLAEHRPRWERLQQLRETALALENELRVAEHDAAAAAERAARLAGQLAEATSARAQLDGLWQRLEPLPSLREEADRLRQQAEGFAARQAMAAQLDELRANLVRIQERLAEVPTRAAVKAAERRVADVRAEHTASVLDAEERRTVWVRDAQDARTKRQGLLDQYRDLKEQRDRLVQAGPDGVCPTCARPLGGEFANVLEVLDRQLEDVLFNGNFYKQRIEQLQAEPPEVLDAERTRLALEAGLNEANAELVRVTQQVHDGGTLERDAAKLAARAEGLEAELARLPSAHDQSRYDDLEREIRGLEPLMLQAERHRLAAERADAIAAEHAEAVTALQVAEAAAADLRRRVAGLDYDEAAYRESRDAEQAADRGRREAELALVAARAEAAAAAEGLSAVARRRAERASREAEAQRTASEVALHQELDRALADLRTELNAYLRPDLSDLASGFLADLTRGRYSQLELDDDYVATLLDDGDPKTVISGGEEDVANLALRLAISQMIAERAGQPLSLLVLDEIFGSLDDDRRTAVVELLRSLADRFPQVILITHIDSVRDGFDRVIRVGYDVARGVATVRDDDAGDHDVAA